MIWVPQNGVLHHTVTPVGTGRAIANQHKYHVVIDRIFGAVVVYDSVPGDRPSKAGTGCYNSKSYSIAVVGNFDIEAPTPELLHSLVQVIVKKFSDLPGHQALTTHQHVGLYLAACRYSTACPGKNLLAKMDLIQAEVLKRLR